VKCKLGQTGKGSDLGSLGPLCEYHRAVRITNADSTVSFYHNRLGHDWQTWAC